MVHVAVIAVVSILGAAFLAAVVVGAVVIHKHRSRVQLDDLDSEEAAVRKLRVRHGRVVSTAGSIFSTSGAIGKKFSSQRNSVQTIQTIDLENDLKAWRQDYPPLPKGSDGKIIGISKKGKSLHTISEKETDHPSPPRPAYSPVYRQSKRVASSLRISDVSESSWNAYNGHRKANDALSSPTDSLPKLKLAFGSRLSSFHPSPTKSTWGESSNQAEKQHLVGHSRQTSRTSTSGIIPVQRTTNDPHKSRSNLDMTQVDVIVSPRAHKPAALELKIGSKQGSGYGYPSPPHSSTFIPPTTPKEFVTNADGKQPPVSPPSYSPLHTSVYVSDVDSAPSRRASQRQNSTTSRSSSKSRKPKKQVPTKSDHRVRKQRPPPIKTGRNFQESFLKSPAISEHSLGPSTAGFLSSPALSEAPSLPDPETLPRLAELANRKSVRMSVQTFASGELSPFAVAPVQRVPLFAGKGSHGREVKLANGKRKPTSDAQKSATSVLRNKTSPLSSESSTLPTDDIASMLMRAHETAQSLEPVTPKGTENNEIAPNLVVSYNSPFSELADTSIRGNVSQGVQERPAMSQNRSISYESVSPRSPPKHRKSQDKGTSTLRPTLSQARSLSGNILLSENQTATHSSSTIASAYPSRRDSRRSRYEAAASTVDHRKLPAAPFSAGIQTNSHRKDLAASNGGTPGYESGAPRKGSLPTRLSEAPGGPPDPKVLSKLLGLTPDSSVAETAPQETGGHINVSELSGGRPGDRLSKEKARRMSAQRVGPSVGRESAKIMEVDRVVNDLGLMSAGLEKGMRRGAVSVEER